MGYTGGDRENPTYGTVCNGDGHTEALRVEFDPNRVSYEKLLDVFMSEHDPCRPMTTQYQSAVWPQNDAQREAVLAAIDRYEAARGRTVTTRVLDSDAKFWSAEWYHQQYNLKNKIRLALAFGVFVLNNIPHGSFPGQETAKTVLGGLVFLSLLPQLVAPFDRLLAVFD